MCNHYTVPTSQSEVTVKQSHDNQPRQDDEGHQVEHTNGLHLCGLFIIVYVYISICVYAAMQV